MEVPNKEEFMKMSDKEVREFLYYVAKILDEYGKQIDLILKLIVAKRKVKK